MLSRSVLIVTCVTALLLPSRAALAEGPATDLFWDAPSGCAAPSVSAPPSVRVTVRQQQGRWLARIKDSAVEGEERLLVGDSCDEVSRAVVVTLSLLSPRAATAAQGSAGAPAPSAALGSDPAGPSISAPPATVPASSAPSGAVAASANVVPAPNSEALNFGAPNPMAQPPLVAANAVSSPPPATLEKTTSNAQPNARAQSVADPDAGTRDQGGREPSPSSDGAEVASFRGALLGGAMQDGADLWSAGGALAFVQDRSRWTFMGDLRLALGAVDHGVRLELQRFGLGLAACKRWDDQLTLLLCAGVGIDVLRGVAPDIARPSPDASVLPGGALQLLLRAPITRRVGALVALGVSGRVRGAQFAVEPAGVVYTFPRTGFSLLAGPELEF